MTVGHSFSIKTLWHFGWRVALQSLLLSAVAVLLYRVFNITYIAIPFLPVATIGTAVAFYMGFKNNQAYSRLWEARALWGTINTRCRMMAAMLIAMLDDQALVKELLYRQLAYINILRLQLRRTIPWATSRQNLHHSFMGEREELQAFDTGLKAILEQNGKSKYYPQLCAANNAALILLREQVKQLSALKATGQLDGLDHNELLRTVNDFFGAQAGCERIKTTPLYRQFSIFSRVFVRVFITLIPFALLNETNKLGPYGVWLTIPATVLVSWVFSTMEQIGEFSENPFDNAVNDVPISTICTSIEIDLKEMMGEASLPPKPQPVHDILM